MIDGQEIATWPPPQEETDDDSERGLSWLRSRRREAVRSENQITLEATYFPAFRTMIEAWSSLDASELRRRGSLDRRRGPPALVRSRIRHLSTTRPGLLTNHMPTSLAREVFGPFVPSIDYPSPRAIKQQLDRAIQRALNRLAIEDRTLLSNAFTKVFRCHIAKTRFA